MNPNPNLYRSGILAALLCLNAMVALNASPVTFQVNMGVQAARGTFNPASDTVVVAGDAINNWSTAASALTNSVTDTNLWLETFDVSGTAGSTVQYKFVINSAVNGVVWEGNVGAGGAQNRSFTLSGAAQTLPEVYFNNVTNAKIVATPVTFQVDMSVQMAQGAFDPSSGTVSVAGDALNNWSTSASMLIRSTTATNVWHGTFTITNAPGSLVAYKFVMNGSTWESRPNRTFTLSNVTETLPVVYFNDVQGLPVDIPLTFQVDMSAQTALGNFNPGSDTVVVAGSFNAWSTSASPLTNSPSNTNLFVGSLVDSSDGAGATVQFKFVINGSTWESTANRNYTITSTNQQTVPKAYFNDVASLGLLAIGPVTGGKVNLTWNAGLYVSLQSATNLTNLAWQTVPNTEGQSNATLSVGPGRTFFRLKGP